MNLEQCRRLFLRDYEINAFIGIYDYEKEKKQKIIIDIDLYVSLAQCTPREDKLEEVLDYNFICDTIKKRIARGHIHLLETLTDDLAMSLLEHHLVQAVRVSIRKTEVFLNCSGIGIEVFMTKQNN